PWPVTREDPGGDICEAKRRALADHVADRRPEAADSLDRESAVLQELREGVDREQPLVGEIEDAALAVIELARQETQPKQHVRNVARAREERSPGLHHRSDPA